MFALSHVYISTQVTEQNSPLLIFGSVLPDIAWSSENFVGRDLIHNNPVQFYNFVSKSYPTLIDLALGVRLHSHIEKGADYYSDDDSIGFAKVEGKKINDEVAELLGESSGGKSLILAHNFIEAAVDLNLQISHPNILSLYKNSLEVLDRDLLTKCLTEYLNLNNDSLKKELEIFLDFLSPQHLSSVELIVNGIAIPLIKMRFDKSVDESKTLNIMFKAKDIMKESYMNYLNKSVDQMKIDFKEIITKLR